MAEGCAHGGGLGGGLAVTPSEGRSRWHPGQRARVAAARAKGAASGGPVRRVWPKGARNGGLVCGLQGLKSPAKVNSVWVLEQL